MQMHLAIQPHHAHGSGASSVQTIPVPSENALLAIEQAMLPVIAEAAEGITDSRGMLIRRPKVWPHGKNHKRVNRARERVFDKRYARPASETRTSGAF
jgi:hypothetical protein